MVHSDARLDTHQCEHTPYETLPRSGRVANTPRRSLLVRTPPRPTARSPPCTPFELRPRCAGGVRPGGFFPGGSPSSSPQPRCPAHAQPTGTRQNRHRLMSSSFPRVWLRRAQSDLSAPSPPRSPTSAINFIRAAGAVFDLELAALLGNGATLAAAVHDKVVAWFDLRYDAAGRKVRGKPHV
jgi:hypothetical protein